MIRCLMIIALLSLYINCFGQYLPQDMKRGLKGAVAHVMTTTYYDHPTDVSQRHIEVFDKNGHFIKAMIYDTSKSIISDFTFQYDSKNLLISYTQYSGKKISYKVVNFYNGLGQVRQQQLYTYGTYNSLAKRFFSYNPSGKPIKVYTNQWGIDIRSYNEYFNYDKKGQKTVSKRDGAALSPPSQTFYSYNDHGDIVRVITSEPASSLPFLDTTLYEYSAYDRAGNWLKKTEYHISYGEKEPRDITIRKITYFKK